MGYEGILGATHIASAQGGFEPQRVSHFSFEVAGLIYKDLLNLSVQSLTVPGDNSEIITLINGNQAVKVAGGTTFEDATISFKDFVDEAVRHAWEEWRNLVRNVKTGAVGRASSYKKSGSVVLLPPDGVGNQRVYTLQGIWPPTRNSFTLDRTDQAGVLLLEGTLTVDRVIAELPMKS